MANQEHLDLLLKYAEKEDFPEWNQWRLDVEGLSDDEVINLNSIKLRKVDLTEATLAGLNLRSFDLRVANLRGANLCGTDLFKAKLIRAELCKVDLRQANLRQANLRQANLTEADLIGVDFVEADLFGARLRGSNLYKANLSKAFLRGADLRGSNINETNITEAKDWKSSYGLPKLQEPNLNELMQERYIAENGIKILSEIISKFQSKNDSQSVNGGHTKEIEALQEQIEQLRQTTREKDEQIEQLNKDREATTESIAKALKQIQTPNNYINWEYWAYEILFVAFLVIFGWVSWFLYHSIFSEPDFKMLKSIENSWPCLVAVALQRVVALSLWGISLTQMYRCRTRIQKLYEQRRGVESLRGVLQAMNELSLSNEKARERIDVVMDQLKEKALSFYSPPAEDKPKETDLTGDKVEVFEECRKMVTELAKGVEALTKVVTKLKP